MPNPCEPCKDTCADSCKDNCSCKDKGCNDCSSKGKLSPEDQGLTEAISTILLRTGLFGIILPCRTLLSVCSSVAWWLLLIPTLAVFTMDRTRAGRQRRASLGTRISQALDTFFPVAFSVTFFVTILLFYCLI